MMWHVGFDFFLVCLFACVCWLCVLLVCVCVYLNRSSPHSLISHSLTYLPHSLGAHLQAAKALKVDLENSEEKEDICITEVNRFQEQIQTIDASLGEYQILIHGVQTMEEELKELHWKNEENIRRVNEKRENLEQEFSDENDTELQTLLEGFEEGMADKVSNLEELKDELRGVHRSISEDRNSLAVFSARRGEAFALKQQAGAQALSLIQLMKEITTSSTGPGASSSASASSLSSSAGSATGEHMSLILHAPDFYQLEADSLLENGTLPHCMASLE
mgnify:CR=1 FL=1